MDKKCSICGATKDHDIVPRSIYECRICKEHFCALGFKDSELSKDSRENMLCLRCELKEERK